MKIFASIAATFCLAALLSPAQAPAQGAPMRADLANGMMGDWRRHEIIRTYRDEEGCRLAVIDYHRADGGVETREQRDCRKF